MNYLVWYMVINAVIGFLFLFLLEIMAKNDKEVAGMKDIMYKNKGLVFIGVCFFTLPLIMKGFISVFERK
jgi:hypothetical protein